MPYTPRRIAPRRGGESFPADRSTPQRSARERLIQRRRGQAHYRRVNMTGYLYYIIIGVVAYLLFFGNLFGGGTTTA